MANQAIPATTPTTIDATYDNWAFEVATEGTGLAAFGAPGPQPPIAFIARGVKFRLRDDGIQERSPLPGDRVTLAIPDIYAAAATKPYIAQALGALLAAIRQYGTETGQL